MFSKQYFNIMAVAVIAAAVFSFTGCDQSANPEVIAAGGTVTINGAPVNNVEVRFIPMQDGLDGNFIARGVTDDEGKFTLQFPGQTESGVCLGENRVIIVEGPMPADARGQSEDAQKIALQFSSKLKYRPLPKKYFSLSESDLSFNVQKGTTEYNVELKQ